MKVTVLAGGVGAARFLAGLVQVVEQSEISVIANVGDDLVIHGLHVSPDIDTVIYTVAGAIDPERGWGLAGESWQAMEMLGRYGGMDWFRLGDRDLGTHLYRTQRLREGARLSTATAEITAAWGLRFSMLPVTDDSLRTMVTVPDEGELTFQEYFVQRAHAVPVASVRFDGAASARPGPGVLEAIRDAERIVIAPSNPIVSIGPLLEVPGVRAALESRRADVVAVSPIIAGAALKGPAARMMTELGHEASAVGMARLYRELAASLVIDTADAASAASIDTLGVRGIVTGTVMSNAGRAADLARRVVNASAGEPG